MNGILTGYNVDGTTWFYLSFLLIVALFFQFKRVWSIRNLDLALLLAQAPGLLLVRNQLQGGYVWLFVVTGLLIVRLCCDGLFQRRPRLEQNLNTPGLAFLCVSAIVFLMTGVLTSPEIHQSTIRTVDRAERLASRDDAASLATTETRNAAGNDVNAGPAASLLAVPVVEAVELSRKVVGDEDDTRYVGVDYEALAAHTIAILAHLAVIGGLFFMGRRHFGDAQLGLAMATLYMLLPVTAYDVGQAAHVLPAALIVWAFAAYRQPLVSGALMGLACGSLFFPIFLIPLWTLFYGRRNGARFLGALSVVGVVLLVSLAMTSADTQSFRQQTIGAIDWTLLEFRSGHEQGLWNPDNSAYRLPVFVAFVVMTVCLSIWPREKNLEHLMAHSAAIVVGTQFWYPQLGGVYLLWYLPLMLLVVFRPRLVHMLPPSAKSDVEIRRADSGQLRREGTFHGTPTGQLYR